MSGPSRMLAGAVSLVLALAVGWLSQVPTTHAGPEEALLRLSWRAPAVSVEACRPRTQEELDALAPHMRTPLVCTGGGADYRLQVSLDGRDLIHETIGARGARGTRPVYVFRELEIAPGRHQLTISFAALVPDSVAPGDVPLSYGLVEEIDVASAEVALIMLDQATSRLVRSGS